VLLRRGEHLEPRKPLHRVDRRRPDAEGDARAGRSADRRAGIAPAVVRTSLLTRAIVTMPHPRALERL
jgi:hypothetical protein